MPASAKVNGTFQDLVGVNAKVNGTWREIAEGYTKVNGTWQQWFAPGGSIDFLEKVTLSSNSQSIVFSNIPSGYSSLHIEGIQALATGGSRNGRVRLNSDANSNYSSISLRGYYGNENLSFTNSSGVVIDSALSTRNNNELYPMQIDVFNVNNTAHYANVMIKQSNRSEDTNSFATGTWRSTAVVNSIELRCDSDPFVAGTTLRLYGATA